MNKTGFHGFGVCLLTYKKEKKKSIQNHKSFHVESKHAKTSMHSLIINLLTNSSIGSERNNQIFEGKKL